MNQYDEKDLTRVLIEELNDIFIFSREFLITFVNAF
jgi:hypothetical protein